MTFADKLLFTALGLLLFIIAFLPYSGVAWQVEQEITFKHLCEQQRGTPVHDGRRWQCLNKQ